MASDAPDDPNGDPPTTPTAQRSSGTDSTPLAGANKGRNGSDKRETREEDGNGAVQTPKATDNSEDEDEEDDEEEEEDDNGDSDDEPKLKYQRLTASLSTLYRNGDASSCFFVGGDKIVRRNFTRSSC